MLQPLLRVGNFYWNAAEFRPPVALDTVTDGDHALSGLAGQYAFAAAVDGDGVTLARDRLGINKLFFAIHESGRVLVSNYVADLISRGAPFDAVYSVPAGHWLRLDVQHERLTLHRFAGLEPMHDGDAAAIEDLAHTIRTRLDLWFSRLAAAFAGREIAVCLSGGLDSATIAACAARWFTRVTAYTYGFADAPRTVDEDLHYAERVARFLGIRFRPVLASAADLLSVVDEALCFGQDWRDFNVHCAMVNAVLARAIDADARQAGKAERPLVLSGDLMNEFLADYTPVSYGGREYYRPPRLEAGQLRHALIRGLDAGDREIGVFNHHGLAAMQPYALLLDDYLRLPASFLASEGCKRTLVRAVAGDRLPACVFERGKVRAQIATAGEPTGILPLLADANQDSKWLRSKFCRLFRVDDETLLDRFVRLGVYRFPRCFPKQTGRSHGYLC